jgi:hypothetical protein
MRVQTGHAADVPGVVHDGHGMAAGPVQSTIADLAVVSVGSAGIDEVLRKLTLASLALVPRSRVRRLWGRR